MTLAGTTRPRRALLQLYLLWAAVRAAASSAGDEKSCEGDVEGE